MTIKQQADRLPKPIYYALYIFGYGVFMCDILWNITFGSVLFLQLPHKKQLTLTYRMKYILITNDGWRFGLAYFICRRLVEPWDWNHCGLQSR